MKQSGMYGSLALGKERTASKVGVGSDGMGWSAPALVVSLHPSRSSPVGIAQRYAGCITVQVVTRVPNDLIRAIDDLVTMGVFASRSDAVRAGLIAVVDRQRRVAVGQVIADGYRRIPQTDDETSWSDAASAAMIAEEPW